MVLEAGSPDTGNGNPTLETTVSILNAVGLTIDIKPLDSQV
ncbi:MAG: hypothetical protein AAGA83_13100 [Cyanobacteria bacterium P01_F01_bin.116]